MTVFSSYFSDEKTHLAVLSKMANANGKLLGSEMMLIRLIAKKLKISEEDRDEIIKFPERYLNNMPVTSEDKFMFFYTMLQMMKLDLNIDEKEIQFYYDFGIKLGYSQKQLDDVLIELKAREKDVVQPEEVKEIMKKIF